MEKKQRIQRKINKLYEYKNYINKRNEIQHTIIINKIKRLSSYFFNKDEINAIIIMILYNEKGILDIDFSCWKKYFDYSDRNKLLALQAMNKYANMNKIRVEDSITVFRENMFSIINKEDYYMVGEDDEYENDTNYEIDKQIDEIIKGEGYNDFEELKDFI
jgi:hypothetical protein